MSSSSSSLPISRGSKDRLAGAALLISSAIPEIAAGNSKFEMLDDSELIRNLQSGCDKSFDVLFARYWKLVYAIAWKILRQRSEAEDVVQDVFLTIYLRRDQYDACRGSVRNWVAQFAHFKALVRRKSLQSIDHSRLDELKEFEAGLSRAGNESVLERAAFVEQCLAALNARQRRVLELVHFEGYTLLETATILKQSLANTRNIYYRSVSSLRVRLLTDASKADQSATSGIGELSRATADTLLLERTCRP